MLLSSALAGIYGFLALGRVLNRFLGLVITAIVFGDDVAPQLPRWHSLFRSAFGTAPNVPRAAVA